MGTRCGVEEKIFQESRATLSGNVAGELSLHGDVVLLTLSDILKCHTDNNMHHSLTLTLQANS